MKLQLLKFAGTAALATGLAACASYPSYPPVGDSQPTYGNPAQTAAVEYGRITNVQLVSQGTVQNQPNGIAGALLGGVVGGVLGNQVGGGTGKAAATILGAVGGAAVGNRLGNDSQGGATTTGPVYRVWVQMDNGVTRTYDVSALGDLHPGDRVRVQNGVIYMA